MTAQTSPPRGSIGMTLSAAAVGLVAGLAAAAGRRAAAKAADALAGDWSDVMRAEHLLLGEAFDMAEAAASPAPRRRLARRIRKGLEKQFLEEEFEVYPVLAAFDAEAAQALFADHAELKILAHRLEAADPGSVDWGLALAALRRAFEAHARQEEERMFRLLRERLDVAGESRLTARLLRAGGRLA